jgi:CubicO group peptidase (beta-lactamase class C family)
MKRIILSVFLISFSLNTVFAETLTNKQKHYEAVLLENIKKDEPGVAVIVSQKGKVLFKGARGLANLEHNIPLTTDSVFRLGSITKQFTAAAIMILQEQQKLSVADNIHKYVPNFPTEGNDITIENLLTHTSGIANYTEDRELFSKEIQVPTTIDDMLIRFAKHPMKFKPGERMRYSNTGYVLLGKIIEVASGQSYANFIEENIFNKLNMKSSRFGGSKIIPNRASGYDRTTDGFVNTMYIDMMWPHAAGSLLSTVNDMNIWFSELRKGELLSKESYQMMIKPFKLNDGSISNYGYGLGISKLNKFDSISHGGGIPGFVTNAFYIPSEDLYIAVLSNLSSGNPRLISNLLAAETLDIPLPKFETIQLNENKVKSFMGSYQIDTDSVRTLSMENGKVFSQRDDGPKLEIIPMSENSFYFENSLSYIVIKQNEEGKQVMNFYRILAVEPRQAIKI